MADDVKYTVSHVVEPMERGIARTKQAISKLSSSVKRPKKWKKKSRDDSYLVPMESRTWDILSEGREKLSEGGNSNGTGSYSDSSLCVKQDRRTSVSRTGNHSFEFNGERWA